MFKIELLRSKQLKLLVEGLKICLERKDDNSLSNELRQQCEDQAKFYLAKLAKFIGGFDDVKN